MTTLRPILILVVVPAMLALPAVGQDDASPIEAGTEAAAVAVAAAENGAAPVGLGGDQESVPKKIRQLMQDRDYDAAVAAIDAALADDTTPADYLTYLQGRALQLAGKYEEAIRVYDSVGKEFPQSNWARRARFAKGVSQARKGDYRAAELTYRAEAEYLLSHDRKQQIADIYIEFADIYFKPPQEEQEPDYEKAIKIYEQAIAMGMKPEQQIKIELRIARCHQNLEDYDDAIRHFEKFIDQHKNNRLVIEARYRLGECRLADDDRAGARRVWQDLLSIHKGTKSERIAEAAYGLALTYGVPQPKDNEDLDLGVAALRSFIKTYPIHELAGPAHMLIAQSYAHRDRYEDAVNSLTQLLTDERYHEDEEIPAARHLLGQAYRQQKKFDEALAAWREYLVEHPTDKKWSEVQREIINTEYLKAEEQSNEKNYAQARQLWGEFLAKYPLDGRNRRILYLFGAMNAAEDKWEAAIVDWARLVRKYPKTIESSQAQYMIAATLEERLGRLDEALEEYKKVTWGKYTTRARQRTARLTAKKLTLATERVFRSDETPALKLTTRNIESVSVRLYTVDLETYFRKMHLARGVEGLDIALINPDRTFEFKVPEYQQYQRLESQIPVPLPKKGDADAPKTGVMAVTVSSSTFEATTLVLQSDLDIIVKSSRDEMLVFAENMRTGKPWPDARVLISDGKTVYAERTTGKDGVLHETFDELKSGGDVRVFAASQGNVASNVVELDGIGVARGLSDRGYIYTDRPAYRAGQMVHIRGVIRKVTDDTYTVATGKKYKLEVVDNRNRLIRHDDLTLNDFGSFHAHLTLPSAASQGKYRILVHDEDKESYQGSFLVEEYQLEPVRVEIDTPRTVYYRGEQIEGTIRASFYHGAPVIGREVVYQLGGERAYTDTTDKSGEIHFSLPTRDFRESQTLSFTAALPQWSVITKKNFFLATQGFTIEASTVRPVYLAGDTFEVSVETVDAEGRPIAKPLTLSVVEQTRVAGRVGEVTVETHELATDDKEGVARQTLRLDKGGTYVLRVEGIDRFDNPVSGETSVSISDEDDAIRLRILADKHTFKVGDTASVQLHWREPPALALLAFQGARILNYKLVELKTGANQLKIPMAVDLAPNFELSVAVMTDPRPAAPAKAAAAQPEIPPAAVETPVRRFHTASSPFQVQRDLRISLAVQPAGGAKVPPKPGDQIAVTVTATNPQGKPVAAEVSLAMVEQALLSRFSSPLAAIQDFFRGAEREPAMLTMSSITFQYRPTTRPINARLLAEADRLALQEEEQRSLAAFHGGGEAVAMAKDTDEQLDDFYEYAPAAGEDKGSLLRDLEREMGLGDFLTEVENQQQIQTEIMQAEVNEGLAAVGGSMGGRPRKSVQELKLLLETLERAPDVDKQTRAVLRDKIISSITRARRQQIEQDVKHQLRHFVEASSWETNTGQFMFGVGVNSNAGITGPIVIDERNFDRNGDVHVMLSDGTSSTVNFAAQLGEGWDLQKAEALAAQLNEQGAVLLPHLPLHETGYWNPAVTTGEDGKATVTVSLPDRSTAWQLLATGVTVNTLAGEATDELVVKKDLFGQLKLPAAFTDGDEADVVAAVHNSAIDKGKMTVTLQTTIGRKSSRETKTLEVKGKGTEDVIFKTRFALPADASHSGRPGVNAVFELTVATEDGQTKDVVRRTVPVRPYGMPVFAVASGTAQSDTMAFVEAPEKMPLSGPSLQILIGPTMEQSLLDVLFAPAPWCQVEASRFATGSDRAVGDLMAALALQRLLGATRDGGGAQAKALDARIRSTISLLVSMQNNDGSWSWTGRGSGSHHFSTARAVWALELAKATGYRVNDDGHAKSINYLKTSWPRLP